MTRFARYSTKGVKKPPLDATPWSELAPPSAAKHAAADGAAEKSLSKPEDEGKIQSETSPDKVVPPVTASASKKGKKKATKRASLPEELVTEFATSGAVSEEVCEAASTKFNDGGKQMDCSVVQSSKKKMKLFGEGVNPSGALEKDKGSMAVTELSAASSGTQSPSKGKKRKSNESNMPKNKNKKKKRLSIGGDVTDAPEHGVTDDQQIDDSSEKPTVPSKLPLRNLNGRSSRPNKNNSQKQQKPKIPKKPVAAGAASGPPLLAEGPLMTQFEGYWVRRRAVPRLEKIRDELAAAISDPQTLKREMKKRKRAEHRLLLSQLAARGARKPTSAAARLQDGTDSAEDDVEEDPADKNADDEGEDDDVEKSQNGVDEDESARAEPQPRRRTVADVRNPSGAPREDRMVKFDGVWMTADAVGRLKELRRQLKMQRVSDVVLKQTMKTARRREEMKRKRDAKRVCLGCRQPGHFISDCPHRVSGAKAPVTGLCFRCGSTEHRLSECRRPADGGKLPYAVCFVCGQTGHLSRDCTLNPNGVYPRGGACKVCHKRDHLADNCPEKKEEEAAASAPRLSMIGDGALEDDYQHDFRETATPNEASVVSVVRKPRQVKF